MFSMGFRLSKDALKVAKLVFVVALTSHLIGCAFFLIAVTERKIGNCDNWADEAGLFPACASDDRDGRARCRPLAFDASSAYIHAFYWAIATLTTVGYGDIHASRGCLAEILFCTLVMFIGTFGVYTQVIASLEDIVNRFDVTQAIFKRHAGQVQGFCRRRQLPKDLTKRVDQYLDNIWIKQRGIGGTKLLRYLPQHLHSDVVQTITGNKLQELFFVKDCPQAAVDMLTMALQLESCGPGDSLFVSGQPAEALHMVEAGSAELFDEATGTVFTAVEGGVVGAGEFFSRNVYPCAARMTLVADVFTLAFEDFWEVLCKRGLAQDFSRAVDAGARELASVSIEAHIDKVRSNLKNKKMCLMTSSDAPAEHRRFTLSPSSRAYKAWKITALFLVLYMALAAPVYLAFGEGISKGTSAKAGNLNSLILAADILFTSFFACDLVAHLTVFTCKRQGRILSAPVDFRRIYVHGDLSWDLLSVVPAFTVVYRQDAGPLASDYSILRLLQFTRVVQIGAYFKILSSAVEDAMPRLRITSIGIRRLVAWAPMILVCNHWCACLFYLTARGDGSKTWVETAASTCYERNAALAGSAKCEAIDFYIQAFYWSLYTLTTTGYGGVQLESDKERIFAIFAMVLGGVICDAGVTSILASFINEKDRESATTKRRIECTLKYLRHHRQSDVMQKRALAYFRHVDSELGNVHDGEILALLPCPLRQAVVISLCYESLRTFAAFNGYTPGVM